MMTRLIRAQSRNARFARPGDWARVRCALHRRLPTKRRGGECRRPSSGVISQRGATAPSMHAGPAIPASCYVVRAPLSAWRFRMLLGDREGLHRCADASQTTRGRRTTIAACAPCCARSPSKSTRPRASRSRQSLAIRNPWRNAPSPHVPGWAGSESTRTSSRRSLARSFFSARSSPVWSCHWIHRCARAAARARVASKRARRGALRGDYTIDATRCISDLTQRTDSIPPAMRPLVGEWVWGCDICQLVCPPTASASKASSRWEPRDRECGASAARRFASAAQRCF